jgi:two-component system chemotaxis sensor kinase CheA
MKALLVEAGTDIVCLPASFLVTVAQLNLQDVAVEGPTPMVSVQNRIVPLMDLATLLDLPKGDGGDADGEGDPKVKVVLVHVNEEYLALKVDRIHRMEEVIVKAAGAYFADAPLFAGVTILRQGDPSFILNVYHLHQLLKTRGAAALEEVRRGRPAGEKKSILVVDDSITTRTMEKSILESAGYEVETAQDAEEALTIAADRVFDIVITDIEMPGLNGFELTKKLKATVMYRDVPVVIVTSLARDEDKKKGIEVGAQAYIVKGSFQQKALLDTVRRLIGS